MVLETDVAGGVTPVMRVTGELARLDFRRPVGTPELVLDHLHAVQPVLDVFPLHHESHLVPLARRLHDAGRRGIHVVGRTRRRETRFAVHVPRVIQHLHFGRVPVDRVVVLAAPVKEPAVPSVCDIPFERQLEIPKLLPRDDVAGGVDPGQRAVHDLPAGRRRVLLVAPPPGGGLTVEQQAPAGGALGGGQRVERCGAARGPGLLREARSWSSDQGRRGAGRQQPDTGHAGRRVHVASSFSREFRPAP